MITMSLTRLFYGLAALPLLASVALAQPAQQSTDSSAAKQLTQLSDVQMDKVAAGGYTPVTITAGQLANITFSFPGFTYSYKSPAITVIIFTGE